MKYKVVILKSAEQDLRELRTYLPKNFGRVAWLDGYEKIKDASITCKLSHSVAHCRMRWCNLT